MRSHFSILNTGQKIHIVGPLRAVNKALYPYLYSSALVNHKKLKEGGLSAFKHPPVCSYCPPWGNDKKGNVQKESQHHLFLYSHKQTPSIELALTNQIKLNCNNGVYSEVNKQVHSE